MATWWAAVGALTPFFVFLYHVGRKRLKLLRELKEALVRLDDVEHAIDMQSQVIRQLSMDLAHDHSKLEQYILEVTKQQTKELKHDS